MQFYMQFYMQFFLFFTIHLNTMKRLIICGFAVLIALIFSVITACDFLIENTPRPTPPEGDWQLLVTTDEAVSRLVVLSQPNNKVVNQNLFLNIDSARGIAGRVSKTYTFREFIYVFLPEQRRIEVLSATTYKRIKTIDFAAQGRIPTDIIFINATTGFIAFENASVLSVLDINENAFKITSDISVGRNPVALGVRQIESSNINEIYCAVRGENQIIVIAGNSSGNNIPYTITERIPVAASPEFLQVNANKSELIVVSSGGGTPRTASRISLIDCNTKRVTREATLYFDAADSSTDKGYGLAATERDFAYIPMSKALIRVDTRTLARAIVLEGVYRSISYNPNRSEILVVTADSSNSPTCTILSQANDSVKANLRLDVQARVRQVISR
jgi:hypothetical protein